jgi:hypothetical protein
VTTAVRQNPEQLPSDEFFDTNSMHADDSRTGEAHSPGKKKVSRTKLWFLVHSWAALPIWIFLFFVCLTGPISTVSLPTGAPGEGQHAWLDPTNLGRMADILAQDLKLMSPSAHHAAGPV